MTGPLAELIELRDLDLDALAARLGIDRARAEPGVGYEGLAPLTALHDPDVHPATFFFHPDGRPAVAYLPEAGAHGIDPAELGEPAARLRSRAGKRDMIWVYPDRGIAISRNARGVSFAEAFQPTTLERYRDAIYREPPAFIR
jgi:hypothetical protein